MIRAVVLSVAILAAAAPHAGAVTMPDAQTTEAMQIAQDFWSDRNLVGCQDEFDDFVACTPTSKPFICPAVTWDTRHIKSNEPLTMVTGRAFLGSCSMTINRSVYNGARRHKAGRRWWLETECASTVHEWAHAWGWMPSAATADPEDPYHSKTGVMAAFGSTPGVCKVWAKKQVR